MFIGSKHQSLSLSVGEGDVLGIIGPNGSEKTTLFRLMAGLMYPDRGEIFVTGEPIKPGLTGRLPSSVGALLESPSFLPQFSGFLNLKMPADIRGKIGQEEIRQIMQQIGLAPQNRKPVRKYSLARVNARALRKPRWRVHGGSKDITP